MTKRDERATVSTRRGHGHGPPWLAAALGLFVVPALCSCAEEADPTSFDQPAGGVIGAPLEGSNRTEALRVLAAWRRVGLPEPDPACLGASRLAIVTEEQFRASCGACGLRCELGCAVCASGCTIGANVFVHAELPPEFLGQWTTLRHEMIHRLTACTGVEPDLGHADRARWMLAEPNAEAENVEWLAFRLPPAE